MNKTSKIKKSPTMRDVAKHADVSQTTVSRVLNRKNTTISISDETRDKVLAAVEELGYRLNMHARSLRTQQTNMIAVLLADITNSFYPHIAHSIQNVARDEGFDMMISNSDHVYKNELLFCEAISRRTVDGIIMVPIHLTEEDMDDLCNRINIPISILGQHIDHPNIDVVYANDEQAVYDATTWLIEEKGHQDVGFVGVPDILPPGPRRWRGFCHAIADAELELTEDYLFEGDFTREGGRQVGKELLKRKKKPTALMVSNDSMAIGLILSLQEVGIRVPEDIAIIGYDDILEASIIRPALTTIEQNSVDIGHKLAGMLFKRIENPDLPSRRLEIPNYLIVRQST